jgi:Spy/CpxP family protein refolding chaperone
LSRGFDAGGLLNKRGAQMRRIAIWTAVGLILVVAAAAEKEFKGGRAWHGHGWHHRGLMGYVARELGLSKAQIAEAHSIVAAERPTLAALLKEMLGEARDMSHVTAKGTFDENRIRAIAESEGNTFTKLLVEKEFVKSRIYTVLDETQRKKADELQQRWLDKLDKAVSRIQN